MDDIHAPMVPFMCSYTYNTEQTDMDIVKRLIQEFTA